MPGTRYSDNAYDFSSRRSIKTVSPTDIITAGDNNITIRHFYHLGEFWTATIPIDGLKQVFGQAFNFSRPKTRKTPNGPEIIYNKSGLPKRTLASLNHLQSRFVFEEDRPIRLFPIDAQCDAGREPTHTLTDIVYSIEAVGPPGVSFNFWDAISGSLVCAHRFMSTQEMVFERIAVEGQYVTESAALPIKIDDAQELLRKSLARSNRSGTTERYYLYRICGTNNCTSNPLQILDTTIRYHWRHRMGALLYRIPFRPRFYLGVRGLDADPGHVKLVRHEFEEFINHSDTRRRRREYVREKIRQKRAKNAGKPTTEVASQSNTT